MQNFVRERINEAIKAQDGEHSAEDLLRSFAHEAALMLQTDVVIRTLQSDPYEHLEEIKSSVDRLCTILSVTDYEKILTKTGYCRIVATVQIRADAKMNKNGVEKYVELYFEYEREGTQSPGDQASAWYSIDVSRDDGPKEKMLWVKVFAAGTVPSILPAKCLDGGEEEGEWEDIDEDDDDDEAANNDEDSTGQAESKMKKARLVENESDDNDHDEPMKDAEVKDKNNENEDDNDDEDEPLEDRFTAGVDPDALEQFFQWTQMDKMQDVTGFFLIMSFPFYEQEFDLVGFVLKSVFEPDDEDDEDKIDEEKGSD